MPTFHLSFLKRIIFSKEKEEPISYSSLNILKPYLSKNRRKIIFAIIIAILSILLLLPIPYLHKVIIDSFIRDSNVPDILRLGCLIFFLYLIVLLLRSYLSYIFSLINSRIIWELKRDAYEKMVNLPLSFFTKNQSTYLVSRINEISQLSSVFTHSLLTLFVSSIMLVFSLIILSIISWKILLLTLIFIPLQYLIYRKASTGLKIINKDLFEKSAQLNRKMQDSISGIKTMKSFTREKKEVSLISEQMKGVYESSMIQSVTLNVAQEIVNFVTNINNLAILIVSAILIIYGQLSLGLYVALIQYINYTFRPIQSFASVGIMLQPLLVAMDRIKIYFEITGEHDNPNRIYTKDNLSGKIVFKDITFSYERDKPLLNEINFIINSGEKIAIMGKNGVGKTTILKLLLQFEQPQSGLILIDDIDATTYDLNNLRKKIGYVSQDIYMFNTTIKENITYGIGQYSAEELDKLLKRFCPFVENLPDKEESLVSEHGQNLSGGQKQAISIIRTLLKKPDILIFDEGSIHLDQFSQNMLLELIMEYFHNKTCIMITHEDFFSPIINRVFTLTNGKIYY